MATNSLDNLAANGIIDFDADSYVKGKAPRYVGDPDGYTGLPLDRPLMAEPYGISPGAQLSGHPARDAFVNHGDKHHGNPTWKKALAAVLIAGLAVFGGIKYKDKIANLFKKIKTLNVQKVKTGVVKFFTDIKSKIVGLPPWAKYAGGGVVGLLGLYGIYKAFSGHKHQPQPHQ
jgi:hypothetical protein